MTSRANPEPTNGNGREESPPALIELVRLLAREAARKGWAAASSTPAHAASVITMPEKDE
jgi:hypothetical protein